MNIICPSSKRLNYDTCTCECKQRPNLIPQNKKWDNKLCKPVCAVTKKCAGSSFWNEDDCVCDEKVCPANIICHDGQKIDYRTCKCVKDRPLVDRVSPILTQEIPC